MTIARQRKFADAIPALLLDEGRILIETGHYVQARERIDEALTSEVATRTVELLIERARVDARLGDVDHARGVLAQLSALPEAAVGDVVPRVRLVTAEVAYAADDMKQARMAYAEAAQLWTDDLPDAASVEARAYVGLIDGLAGKPAGRAAVEASLAQARRMQRPLIEALTRVFLARLDLQARQPQMAATRLEGVQMDAIGPEAQAQVHYWRAAAAAALGNDAAAQQGRREVARILTALQQDVPETLRPRFLLRPEIGALRQ
jgi:hypothetical protein